MSNTVTAYLGYAIVLAIFLGSFVWAHSRRQAGLPVDYAVMRRWRRRITYSIAGALMACAFLLLVIAKFFQHS